MSTKTKTYSAGALYASITLSLLTGGLIYYFFLRPPECALGCAEEPKPVPVVMTGFFDSRGVNTIVDSPDAWGGRFYLAKSESGALSVLAGPIDTEGRHIADASGTLQFQLFKALAGDAADMTWLNEAEAERVVKDASTSTMSTCCLDVTSEVLKRSIDGGGPNGIGLQLRRTTDGGGTFELASVRLSEGAAYLTGSPEDILVGAGPCPIHCPREDAVYLHMR